MTESSVRSNDLVVGVPGFAYADLYDPFRLRDLHAAFLNDVARADPDLSRQWAGFTSDPDRARAATEVSLLYVRMAPHVSRFVARLFGVEQEVAAIAATTRAHDSLFRFRWTSCADASCLC